MSELRLRSMSLEQMDRTTSNFEYGLVLTRSRWKVIPVIFRKFVTEL